MFIMPARKKAKNKTYTYYNLVNTVRTPKGPRHRVVLSLGKLDNVAPRDIKLLGRLIERELSGTIRLLPEAPKGLEEEAERIAALVLDKRATSSGEGELIKVDPEAVSSTPALLLGPVYVGWEFWKKLGTEEILRECGLRGKQRRLACVEVISRLVAPGSELKTSRWIERTALGSLFGESLGYVNKDALYRISDVLWRHHERIERALCRTEGSLFSLEECLVLYDLTSTYFEGLCGGNPKARRGYSRDRRSDCKQVVVGMVLDEAGFPKATEIYEGNRRDCTTLENMLAGLEKRMGKLDSAPTVVMDRGLATEENVGKLKSRGYHYLVAASSEDRDEWIGVLEAEEFTHVEASRKDHPGVEACIRRREEELYLFVRSEPRVKKDEAIRQRFVSRMQTALQKLSEQVRKGRLKDKVKIERKVGRIQQKNRRASRFFDIRLQEKEGEGQVVWQLDEQKLEDAKLLDGCYTLKSDRTDLDEQDLWSLYTMLSRVERSFRYLKTSLGIRPNYHQMERRVEGHIFISILAYHLLHAVEQILLASGEHRSWPTIKEELETHRVITVRLPDAEGRVHHLRLASNPNAAQKKIYTLLGLSDRPLPRRCYMLREEQM